MRNQFFAKTISLLSSCMLLYGCHSGGGQPSTTYDGRQFDISAAQDGSLIATSTKQGNYYDLTITGVGEARSYERKEQVPWYPIVKKITKVTIREGITNIGDYYFYSLPMKYFLLPSTITRVEAHSFNGDSILYTYGSELPNVENVYYYSESKPAEPGNYFYLDADQNPHIWKAASVLFVGNSFTYYQGSEEDPAVPRYFKAIAENLNQEVNVDFVVRESHTLTKFASENDPYGKIVDEKLKSNFYDYVILQEQSTSPIQNYNSFLTAVTSLKTKIDAHQENCQTILYETWGSPTAIQNTGYLSVGDMEKDLRSAYERAGDEVGCSVHYVGKAFTYVYENSDIDIYADDRRHQNNYGAYLSAAIHVRGLFGFNVSNCTDYAGLSESQCKALLSVADQN